MIDTVPTAKPVEDLLDLIIRSLGLDLLYRIVPSQSTASSFAQLKIEIFGPDASLLTVNDGELLHAIEHIAAKILNLEPDQHDRISLDADKFKEKRDLDLQRAADAAIVQVQKTGQPFAFPPMTSRERRILHLALQHSGLPTASSGEAPRRFVVLYPMTRQPNLPARPTLARTDNIRNAFRPR